MIRKPFSLFTLPPELNLFGLIALLSTLLAWGAVVVGHLLHLHYPPLWPLVQRGSTMIDLRMYMDRFQHLHHEGFFTDPGLPFVYFAPGVFLYPGFFVLGPHGAMYAYTAVTLFALAFAFLSLRRSLVRAHLSSKASTAFLMFAAITSYPILFTAERGNLR